MCIKFKLKFEFYLYFKNCIYIFLTLLLMLMYMMWIEMIWIWPSRGGGANLSPSLAKPQTKWLQYTSSSRKFTYPRQWTPCGRPCWQCRRRGSSGASWCQRCLPPRARCAHRYGSADAGRGGGERESAASQQVGPEPSWRSPKHVGYLFKRVKNNFLIHIYIYK